MSLPRSPVVVDVRLPQCRAGSGRIVPPRNLSEPAASGVLWNCGTVIHASFPRAAMLGRSDPICE
jgi:hypothetical protein